MCDNFIHGLSKNDIERFSRQLLLKKFGVKGQISLKETSVLIIGAGGLGCPVASYLAASGVGRIGIVDHDKVSLDNLHRQILHSEVNIGQYKVDSIRDALLRLNSACTIDVHPAAIDSSNAFDLSEPYSIIVDCSDNVATRYLVNDLCVLTSKPLVSGSALGWEGQLTVYNNGKDCPCYRCIFPDPPPPETVTNCSEGGVLGPVTGIIGSLQALEVIKLAINGESSYSGKLFVFDGLDGIMRTVSLRKRNVSCVVCGKESSIKQLVDYEQFCQMSATDQVKTLRILQHSDRICVKDFALRHWQTEEERPLLIDVRASNEFDICHLPNTLNIPLPKLTKMGLPEIKSFIHGPKETVFLVCHRGNDSQLAVKYLNGMIGEHKFKDLIGGLQSWALEVDSTFPVY